MHRRRRIVLVVVGTFGRVLPLDRGSTLSEPSDAVDAPGLVRPEIRAKSHASRTSALPFIGCGMARR